MYMQGASGDKEKGFYSESEESSEEETSSGEEDDSEEESGSEEGRLAVKGWFECHGEW